MLYLQCFDTVDWKLEKICPIKIPLQQSARVSLEP